MNFRRHLRGAEVPWSQITPLLTVVFVLFCLFVGNLVLAPVARNEMRIHLPVSTSGQSIEHGADELIVELASNHVMTVNGQALSRDELRARLLQLSREVPVSVVLVRADRDTSVAHVLAVLDDCRNAEIDKYSVVVVPDEYDAQ